jgi:hypothetical protein
MDLHSVVSTSQDENESLSDVSDRGEDCNEGEGEDEDEDEDEEDGDEGEGDEDEDEGDEDEGGEDEDEEVEDEEVEDDSDEDAETVIDDSQNVLEIIWLTKKEFKSDLTTLLAGTSRRPKTISNFVAPEIMRDTVKRCKEFPGGVYINIYGEICPDDPRTGVYRMIAQGSTEGDHPFVSEDVSGDDESDIYSSESSSDEDGETESEEEDDDDWKEYERPSKKQKTSLGGLEISEVVPLTDEEKKSLFFTELQQASQDVESHYSSYSNSRKKNTYRLKLLHHTQTLIEEWNVFRKKKKTTPFEMTYDSGVWCEEPYFEFSFKKKNVKDYVKASIDCDKMIVRCQCSTTSNTMKTFLEHLKISH